MRRLFLIFLVFCNIGCMSVDNENKTNQKLLVLTSISPLADFTSAVCGDKADVVCIVPPNTSAHTYQLTPDQMNNMEESDLLVLNGLSLEYWVDDVLEASENDDIVVVDTSEGIEAVDNNPHVWLSPKYAIYQTEKIRDALISLDEKNSKYYTENAQKYIKQLNALDSDIKKLFDGKRNKKYIAYHGAWQYFADEYALCEVGIIHQSPGKEPNPSDIANVIKKAKASGVKVVFGDVENPKGADVVAAELGVKAIILNPICAPNYIDAMYENAEKMANAFE